jgi:sigma-B regulation protein RsbU (phosphoserine phosphatase)
LRRSRLIWRLRERLIVTYMFMGAVPIILILALAFCGGWIVVGQVATYLVSSEISRRASTLENPARFLSQSRPQDRPEILKQMGPLLHDRAPGFEILVVGDQTFHYPPESNLEAPPEGWRNYTGTAYKDGAFYSMALVRSGPRTAVILAPLTPAVLEKLVPGIGSFSLSNLSAAPRGSRKTGLDVAGQVPPAYNMIDFETFWANPIDLADWKAPNAKPTAVLTVSTRPSAVLDVVFADRVDAAQNALVAFIAISCLLAFVELISIIVGVSMTRTITGAVHNLYEGTLRIGRGDFSHHIPVKGRDQLAALGKSFNEMSEQLEKLVAVAKEKERLQSELTIASDVQNQLFPRSTPAMRTIEFTGSCEPARSVSGDYYDYLSLPNGELALAIGDVAGKGISAALLMASIQSIMRTQLAQGIPMAAAAGNGRSGPAYSTGRMVAQLNRQLYASTAPEKYATFFFGIYDETSRMLTYTNAGHLSPLLVCGGKVTSLDVTGTVVGLFPSLNYQEQTVKICAGDMLIAYTDGITEPENAYGEEYGVDRLAETVLRYQNAQPREIVAKVMESVKHWSGAPELPDDMTVLIARGIA